jgi:Carboxypeptidase regulatory-like domain/Putative zinc-finger
MVDRRHLATHPDENLLSAFAEHALTGNERESVLEHLSACARCRDVVFVAQQALSAAGTGVAPVSVSPDRPRLRWAWQVAAGAIAVLLVAGPILVYRYRGRTSQKPDQLATTIQAEAPAAGPVSAPTSNSALSVVPQRAAALKPLQSAASADGLTRRAESGAEIRGSVADRSGAAIGGASVSVRALSSGTTQTTVTDPRGQFDVGALPSGKYEVQVQAPGFNGFTEAVTVQPSEQASVDAKLDVGAASQTVTVASGFVGGLATESPSPTAKAVNKGAEPARPLPLSGRNMAAAAVPAPPPPQATQPVTVTAAQAPIVTGPLATGAAVNGAAPAAAFPVAFPIKDGVVLRCIGTDCVARNLPSSAKAVSAAGSGLTVMAVDSEGNLYLSSDQGEHWSLANMQWSGKAVSVRTEPVLRLGVLSDKSSTAPSGESVHGAMYAKKPPSEGAAFELTNDKGQTWVSLDEGKTWLAK